MCTLQTAGKTFTVQHLIHVGGTCAGPLFVCAGPQIGEGFRVSPPAFEAGPVAGGKCGYLVEEKQLGVSLAPHLAPAAVELEAAADPGSRKMAAAAQRPVVAVKPSAPIAQQRATGSDSQQFTKWIDAIG